MLSLTPELRTLLRSLDKNEYRPLPRDLVKRAPSHALHVLIDGITPAALARASTPTLDALARRGATADHARGVFPTITGPSHTSMLTGARVGAHGFLYPKMLDAYGNRLLEFSEGLMRAETIAEAWRPLGLTTAGIGSRFLRGADLMLTEGVVGEDYLDITDAALDAIRAWQPNYLHVVYYVADSAGHLYGPESDETLWAIGQVDQMVARLLDAYAEQNLDGALVVVVNADHGMVPVNEIVPPGLAEAAGALPHGRLALAPRAFDRATFDGLMNDPRVDDIFARDELELLGAYGPRWGEHVLQLGAGWMFESARPMKGYHGAWTASDNHIPLLLSGAGIRPGAKLEPCELIDLAPTLSLLLGAALPENAQGRILWEALDLAGAAPNVSAYLDLLSGRDRALLELKRLKAAAARGGLPHPEYQAERSEILLGARTKLVALEQERRRLNEWQRS